MITARTKPGRGFTLVELLVVITIIGLLVAIMVPAVSIVLNNTRNARISMEISSLAQAIEAYKLDAGDYPPNFDNGMVVARHIAKRWQQIDRAKQVAANNADTNPQFEELVGQLDPSEALVFWLGGQSPNGGLRANDVYPLQPLAASGEVKEYFSFDQGRLVDLDGDGWYSYAAPYGQNAPFVYFDSRCYNGAYTSTYTTAGHDVGTIDDMARGIVKPAPNVNGKTFQIIAPGQDGKFGGGGSPYPDGPYTDADKDNIANFTEGRTFEDARP